ncbi:hypothetical protein GH714_035347 [Hevea brasiliensis]|uniref:F-box domain-containing protein n=1 Tax=Hevea brasiliensis TaxID=3981 RepID=A0A6A6M844_HEVBR|nr:hypothetical protein GH714_035347 [Hevea brasiliensis]
MDERVEAAVDYISLLPEHILHHILSFLPIKQIAKTSALSKTWCQAWNAFQILEFDFNAIFSGNRNLYRYPDLENNRQKLYDTVEQILLRRRRQMITLTKFTVIVPAVYQRPEVVSTMDRWICHALGSHVKDLKIAVGPSGNEEEYSYSLPQPVFNAISIQTLQILDHHANLLKLRVERLEHLEQIKLEAHNLRSLELHGPSWPSRLEVVSLKNLTSLIISKAPITDKWLNEQLNKFAHLENLDLFSCPMLTSIKIWSSHIHTLHISSCKELARIEIDTPNLSSFSYSGDIISFSSNDLILSKVMLCLESKIMDVSWYIRWIEFLDKFNQHCKVLNWKLTKLSYSKGNKTNLIPPLCKVKELKLSISNQDESFTTAELVDAMLWISPHLQSLRIDSSLKSFFKFSYKQPTNEGESGCYKSLPVSCWNHCMEEVNIKQISYAVIPTWHYYTEDVQMKPISNHEERSYILKKTFGRRLKAVF